MNNSDALQSHGLILQLGRVSFFILWQHFNVSHTNIVLGARNELDSLCFQSPTWNTLASFSEGMNASSPSKKGNVGCEHQLCKLSSRCCKRIWHCPLKSAGVRPKSFSLGTRGTPLFDSLCTFSLFWFPTLRANSCNINYELLMGKNPLKWQPVIKIAIAKVYVFCKMNEWNQMARWLCSGAFTQGRVTSVLPYYFLKGPPLPLHIF